MGRIRKEIFVSIVLSLLVMKSIAQELDTIYIIDYWAHFGAPWNKNSAYLLNKGMTIRLSTNDSIFLKADYKDTRLKLLRWNTKEKGFVEGAGNLRIESLRIIKPVSQPLQLQISSLKRMDDKYYSVDTSFVFDSSHTYTPNIFINLIRSRVNWFKRGKTISNKDFAWKNNYKRPDVMNAILKSVKYEYRLPERKLIQIK